jgi:NAD+ synthase
MDRLTLEKKIQSKLKAEKTDEKKLISEIRAYFKRCKKEIGVIGLSGGVDSALVCYLAAKALGPEKIFAYHMSYVQKPNDEQDCAQLSKMLGVNYQKFDIRRVVDSLAETFRPNTRIASGNLRVRTRMLALYTFAHNNDGLVLGTGNRTEILLGYFTKYGDGGSDLLPIGNLYKTQVWEMAKLSGLPSHIIEKVPSAGLWDGQTDEKEIGVTYSEIDRILCGHFDLKVDWESLIKMYGQTKVDRVKELHTQSEHKRRMPDILTI